MNSSQFRQFDRLYRFSHHPAFPIAVLALCLPPARWGPREADSQCSGNIASFRWIYSNLIKHYLIISWYLHVRNRVAVAAYIRLASRSQAKFQNNEIESHSGFRAHCTCAEHGISLSFSRFSPSDLFSAGQADGFLATATPFRTWRYQLIIR